MTGASAARLITAWQPWPVELAREWLGLEFVDLPPAARAVQALLREAEPLLSAASPVRRVQ